MTLAKSILSTLAYYDIFNYPLTINQLHKYLYKHKATVQEIKKSLTKIKKVKLKNKYYFLEGKEKKIESRVSKLKYSSQKLKTAHKYANILKKIPSIKLVAVTGSLAMENSHKNDDIDFMIITKSSKLWTTRFLANVSLFPYKRSPEQIKSKDKACLNIFLDESYLKISPQNIYTAHEICQIIPLVDKDETYTRLIEANSWVNIYFPNWKYDKNSKGKSTKIAKSNPSKLEKLMKSFQLKYMEAKITTEKVGDKQLFFHPKDTQLEILRAYKKRLKQIL